MRIFFGKCIVTHWGCATMKRYLGKKSSALIIFVLASIICEVVTFCILGFGLFPTYFLIQLSLTLIVASIIFIIPGHNISVVLYSVVLLFQCVLSVTNIVLYRVFGDIFTTDLLALVREAKAAVDAGFWIDFSIAIPFAILFIAMLVVQIILLVAIKEHDRKTSCRRHGALALTCMAIFIGGASLLATAVQVSGLSRNGERSIFGVSVRENYEELKFKIPFFQAFGTFGLVYRNFILNTQPSVKLVTARSLDETVEYFKEGEQRQKVGYFCDEKCDTYCENALHFTPDANNNVIAILLESFEDFMIHPVFTPALHGLQQKSIVFDNFYSYNKTDVSEASVIFGSYPMGANIVPKWKDVSGQHSGNMMNPLITTDFPFSLPNVLHDNGYQKGNYFHNSSASHYSREYTHPLYGFEKAYFLDNFPIGPAHNDTMKWRSDWTWYVPEKDFFEHAIDLILPENEDKPFFSFITTINVHGTYEQRNNLPDVYYEKFDFITKNEDEYFADIKERFSNSQFMNFKVAMMKAMVADEGIAYLLEQLEERGIAENTTILAFADHNAYGNNLSYNMKQSGRNTSTAHKIPAFLYSPKLAKHQFDYEPLIINKFTMHFDLVPTLLDLLGIEYNQRMYLGFNAFDERENIIISKLGIIFNDKLTSDGMNVLWSCPSVTESDLAKFREDYLDLLYRWSFVNNLYSPEFRLQSDLGDLLQQ